MTLHTIFNWNELIIRCFLMYIFYFIFFQQVYYKKIWQLISSRTKSKYLQVIFICMKEKRTFHLRHGRFDRKTWHLLVTFYLAAQLLKVIIWGAGLYALSRGCTGNAGSLLVATDWSRGRLFLHLLGQMGVFIVRRPFRLSPFRRDISLKEEEQQNFIAHWMQRISIK